jgi:hypothetical protein
MANNIYNSIKIRNINSDVVQKVEDIFKPNPLNLSCAAETVQLVNGVFDNIWANGEADYNRNWVVDNCGAKWFFGNIDHIDEDDTITISMESAWDPIIGWVEKFTEVLCKIKPDIYIEHRFEDEAYNFAGVSLTASNYSSNEYIDIEKWDVNKLWDDEMHLESFHDELNDMMEEEIDDYLDYLKDKENE